MNYGEVSGFAKVLSGLSRGLGVAGQVIPLYEQTKPLFKNARNAYSFIKKAGKTPDKNKNKKTIVNKVQPELKKETINNSPQFFI